jgi:hypothetical protein
MRRSTCSACGLVHSVRSQYLPPQDYSHAGCGWAETNDGPRENPVDEAEFVNWDAAKERITKRVT